jgi:hypothetical protein
MRLRSWPDRRHSAPSYRPAPRPPDKLFLEPLEDRDLLSGGESPSLVALGGATPRPIQLPLALAASPFNPPGLDIYQNFQGPADQPPLFGNDPNQVTDFIGLYAGARVQGDGTGRQGNGPSQSFFWDADLRFMQGVYRGVNGQLYARTFIEV